MRALSAVVTLNDRRREALAAIPAEPPSDLTDDVRVRWWDLLKAGYESVPYLEPLRDEELALAGKPWRVLKKGSLRIPVIRLPADNYHAGRFWVYVQHRVRLAAYARLLAACEVGETPYAVILFGGGYEGVAVPVLPEELVRAKLEEFRRCLDLEWVGVQTAAPPDPRVCSGCPFGLPRAVSAADRRDEALGRRLHVVTGPDGRGYHSECGDRFRWTPPHAAAIRKRLVGPG
jgi:hypothetical protein